MTKNLKKLKFSILSTIILIIIWKLLSVKIGAKVILPNPEETFYSVIAIIKSDYFITKLSSTLLRGTIGFLLSFISGVLIGTLAGVFPSFKSLILPLLSFIKSTPVISIILLALIWFNINFVPIFVALLMAFPIVCTNIIKGFTTVDRRLLEMAKVYHLSLSKQIFNIYIPSIIPFIVSGASMSLGIIWKVVVAAEVLSQPKWGIGTSLNEAKAFLITEEVFAWTTMAILLSVLSDSLFYILNRKINWRLYENRRP